MLSLERRVELGKQVREFLDFIGEQPSEFWDSFYSEMKRRELIFTLADNRPTSEMKRVEELTIKQIQIFEEVEMPFGVFQGTKIKDVSYGYLCNLFDPSPFMKKLKAYLEYCLKYRHRD